MSAILTQLIPLFRSKWSNVIENDVISRNSQIEIFSFAEKGEKKLENSTTHHSQACNL